MGRPLDMLIPTLGWKPASRVNTGLESEALASRMNDAVSAVLDHAHEEEFGEDILLGAQVLFALSNLGAAVLTRSVERV